METLFSRTSHAGSCPSCHYVFPPIWEAAPMYFERGVVTCSDCQTQADLWDVVRNRIIAESPIALSLINVGASQTAFIHDIKADRYHEIDLSTFGVPANAKVLQVGYTPQGGDHGTVFPIEHHGNVPQRRIEGNVLRLVGRAAISGDGTVGTQSPVAIWVVWAHAREDDGWSYIVDGFDAYIYGEYQRVIVPAQSAVEVSLMPIVRGLLERHASIRHVDSFMGDRLTFGNVVNVLLPFVCGQAGIPKLPVKVIAALNQLRKLRNRLVHAGEGKNKITPQIAGEALCAAVFGFEYVRYAAPKLRSWLT